MRACVRAFVDIVDAASGLLAAESLLSDATFLLHMRSLLSDPGLRFPFDSDASASLPSSFASSTSMVGDG